MWKTKVCEILNIEYPIIEGGMSMPGNGALAAAVSNAGGLGVIGVNPGWSPPDEQVDNLRNHIRQAKTLTKKPFGVCIPRISGDVARTRESIDMAIEEGVSSITTSGGDPTLFTEYIKAAGLKVIHVALNVKMARKAEQAGVDIVVASGFEAGGVLGPDEIPTMVIVPLIVDSVKVPVVAAGGIADGRGFLAALALGAQGIQMGTRFVATNECHAHQSYKEAIVKAGDTDTIVIHRSAPPGTRALKTEFTKGLQALDRSGATTDAVASFVGLGRCREAIMLGDIVGGEPQCGAVAGLIKGIESAEDVVKRIVGEASDILARCSEMRDR